MKKPNRQFISAKYLFMGFLIIAITISLIVFLIGLDVKRTILSNSLISVATISLVVFLFLTIALYYGIRLKEDVGNITKHTKFVEPGLTQFGSNNNGLDLGDLGEGFEGVITSVILWILVTFFLTILLFFFETIVWGLIVIMAAILYWVFYRAVKLVIYNGRKCRGNLGESLLTGAIYTILYSSWIYLLMTGLFLKRT